MKECCMCLVLFFWRIMACLPRCCHHWFASAFGRLSAALVQKRARVIQHNLAWCFTEMSLNDREKLYAHNLTQMGQSFFDTGVAWFWSDAAIHANIDFEIRGLEGFLEHQRRSEKGILLLGKHSQHLELDARLLGLYVTGYGVARGSDSVMMNRAMYRGRKKASVEIGAKTNPRQFVRWLKTGKTVAYFPDQDYGPNRAIVRDLFGVPATFTTAPYTLCKLSGCLVYFYNSFYEGKKLVIELEYLELPQDSAETFTEALAAYLEAKIAQHPAEYLWAHRRFKSTKGKACYT